MKNLFLTLMLVLFSLVSMAQSGKVKDATSSLSRETAKFLTSPQNQSNPEILTVNEFLTRTIFFFSFFLSSDLYESIQNVVGNQETRPIKMFSDGKFIPQVIVLDPKRLSFNSANNPGYGMGTIPVTYDEVAPGNTREHGIYKLLIRTEFIPSATTATTLVTAVVPVSSQPIIQNTMMVAPESTSTNTATSQPVKEPANTPGGSKGGTPRAKSSG